MWTTSTLKKWGQECGARLSGALVDRIDPISSAFSINTRTLKPGDIFVALTGDKQDGHAFIDEAFLKGASGAMVRSSWFESQPPLFRANESRFFIIVPDPLAGLQSLAAWHRQSFECPLIGITGSNGKTTTKEILAKILEQRGPILKTEGNFNNQIGLPLSLLGLKKEDQAAVLEMGVSHPGDMQLLCKIAKPTVAMITNIGTAHLAFLKNPEGVAAEKGILFASLPKNGIAIINRDDPYLAPWEKRVEQKWTYGIEQHADITASDIEQNGDTMQFNLVLNRNQEGGGGKMRITLPLVGKHQIYNALAAATAAIALGYHFDEIRAALCEIRPAPLRGEVISYGGATILLDAYNANPASMRVALQTLATFVPSQNGTGKHRKVAFLGDMLELGEVARAAHKEAGKVAAKNQIDRLIAVGHFSEAVAQGAIEAGMRKEAISTYKDLSAIDLEGEIQAGDIILIKGSRGMGMEQLLGGRSH
ncbi:MAG: UDP-N-acetylmuramoyl-tripeptide--D-alanyl-D-alanine ligase [Nitrospirota bacterium]|mgnify:CR=1 FL=1